MSLCENCHKPSAIVRLILKLSKLTQAGGKVTMRTHNYSALPKYTTDEIRRYVNALPVVSHARAMNERTSQATRSILGDADPLWEQRLRDQVDSILREITRHLDYDAEDKRYAITETELRGIIAMVASRTSGQYALDIGQALTATTLGSQFAAPADSDTVAGVPDLQESLGA